MALNLPFPVSTNRALNPWVLAKNRTKSINTSSPVMNLVRRLLSAHHPFRCHPIVLCPRKMRSNGMPFLNSQTMVSPALIVVCSSLSTSVWLLITKGISVVVDKVVLLFFFNHNIINNKKSSILKCNKRLYLRHGN